MSENAIFYALEGPLDVMPTKGQVRAANLQGFVEFALQHNADARRILAAFDIDTHALTNPDAHVGTRNLVAMFEYCSELFGNPLFGLHLALRQPPEVFGCVTALARSSPDLRTALRGLVEYTPIIHSPEAAPELVELGEVANLRWQVTHDVGFNDQANLQAVGLQVKLLRSLAGERFRPRLIELVVDCRQQEADKMGALLGCPVRVRSRQNAIHFDTAELDAHLPTADRVLHRLLGGYLDRVRSLRNPSFVDRVRDYARGALPNGSCTIERCAEKFGLSVRTVQSRLAEGHTSFTGVVEELRLSLAKSHLEGSDATLDEIAEVLGYGEQTSFGRAFKRWTGMTPKQYRAASQAMRVKT